VGNGNVLWQTVTYKNQTYAFSRDFNQQQYFSVFDFTDLNKSRHITDSGLDATVNVAFIIDNKIYIETGVGGRSFAMLEL